MVGLVVSSKDQRHLGSQATANREVSGSVGTKAQKYTGTELSLEASKDPETLRGLPQTPDV